MVKEKSRIDHMSWSSSADSGDTRWTMLSLVTDLITDEVSMKFCDFSCALCVLCGSTKCENWPHFRGPGNRFWNRLFLAFDMATDVIAPKFCKFWYIAWHGHGQCNKRPQFRLPGNRFREPNPEPTWCLCYIQKLAWKMMNYSQNSANVYISDGMNIENVIIVHISGVLETGSKTVFWPIMFFSIWHGQWCIRPLKPAIFDILHGMIIDNVRIDHFSEVLGTDPVSQFRDHQVDNVISRSSFENW